MRKTLTVLAAALGLAVVGFLLTGGIASAAPYGTSTPTIPGTGSQCAPYGSPCTTPPPTVTTPPVTPPSTSTVPPAQPKKPSGPGLAYTGVPVYAFGAAAVVLVVGGITLVLLGRRQEKGDHA